MAALDFPASPTVGQKYPSPAVAGVPVYSWDGEKWTTLGGAIGSTGASDAIPLIDAGTGAAGSSTLWSRGDHAHPPITTSPTPPPGDNDTSIATTAFVSNAVSAAVGGIPGAPSAVVRYDIAQTLTAPQLIQARQNIYAAPFDAMSYSGLQINGAMEVSQEKGTSGTNVNGAYPCDGWKLQFAGAMVISSGVAAQGGFFPGFLNQLFMSAGVAQTSLGAGDYTFIVQGIEGYRIARLAWGTANVQPITIGFWSAHHRTGVYSVVVRNGASNRSYATTYTHNVSDTPQYNTVTIPGDTAGTWATDNTAGLVLSFAMGSGSNFTAPSANTWQGGNFIAAPGQINGVAATTDAFRLTGVIVLPGNEAPSAARSPFVMRSYGEELMTCRRYYQRIGGSAVTDIILQGYGTAAGAIGTTIPLNPIMRAIPTVAKFGTWGTSNISNEIFSPSQLSIGWQLTVAATGGAVSYSNIGGLVLDARL